MLAVKFDPILKSSYQAKLVKAVFSDHLLIILFLSTFTSLMFSLIQILRISLTTQFADKPKTHFNYFIYYLLFGIADLMLRIIDPCHSQPSTPPSLAGSL